MSLFVLEILFFAKRKQSKFEQITEVTLHIYKMTSFQIATMTSVTLEITSSIRVDYIILGQIIIKFETVL